MHLVSGGKDQLLEQDRKCPYEQWQMALENESLKYDGTVWKMKEDGFVRWLRGADCQARWPELDLHDLQGGRRKSTSSDVF